jgi:hypothetical protein
MTAEASPDTDTTEEEPPLPTEVIDEAERLTRLERAAVDDSEATACRDKRRLLLSEHDYTARLRTDDGGEVLILHPDSWVRDTMVVPELVEDISRAIEVQLDGVGTPGEWDEVEAHNRAVVTRLREKHGAIHGDNGAAFADFMGNHYARPVEQATDAMIQEFLTEYFVRNAWPTDQQRAAVGRSVDLIVELGRNIN